MNKSTGKVSVENRNTNKTSYVIDVKCLLTVVESQHQSCLKSQIFNLTVL